MNKYNQGAFEAVKNAAEDYKKEITRALHQYRQAMTAARQAATAYKDESGFLAGKKDGAAHTARNCIAMAENVFTAVVKAETGGLRDELDRHLITVPPDKFISY